MVVRVVKVLFTALVIAGAVFFIIRPDAEKGRVLRIKDAESGRVYGKKTLGETREFAIEFIHSVHQSPVLETFRAENGMIRVVSVRFASFGAGMQSDLEEGQTLIRDGDAMVITGYNASYKAINYIVGTVSDHILYVKDEAISLRELCGRNAHIEIQIK